MPGFKLYKNGLKRPVQVVLNTTVDEDELITRLAYKKGLTKREYLFAKIFRDIDVRKDLKKVRDEQRGIDLQFRRVRFDG